MIRVNRIWKLHTYLPIYRKLEKKSLHKFYKNTCRSELWKSPSFNERLAIVANKCMLRTMARKTLCAIVGIISKFKKLIVGSTGAGKSQLSIDLARALNGEIINGDSMQVYRGADVLTNKVTKEEMGDVKHHLLGYVDPREKYDVLHFTRDATDKVFELEVKSLLTGED